MVSPQTRSRFRFIRRSPAQTRILDAALQLIAEHGVGGTSLQMIADAIGVTKAAVYHQFKTKEQIVIALTERELGGLEEALEAAEADDHRSRAREVLLDRVIDVAVERRGAASTLQFDPVIVRLLGEHEPFQQFIQRLYGVLLDDAAEDARVAAAMLSGAVAVGVVSPLVADIDDDTLRAQVGRITRRLIGAPE
ncbi:TetR family transcriptional regulator [Mycobacterium paraense]|uniref:TetR family transcriptional regulator n=1 Tax=Mycobacterium paraense TaxID=767916 RepID=A0ABX3VG73_9MYCO|nr:TetR/AcrR family transcriptional regulator [Mycobacterium paraense]MCV7441048.1 TetR/AcrR family transcriptional regulator [Mycobacterium paraense]ORW26980.1 TetR family transcriptional regulator [Mycobacterium paraense]ORW45305.1 TetR family transcriptional regulator [Mycobacterium paraense]ORW49385.1 TetR family transcriptional regulator [Mycobacterium paraense]